MGSRSDWLCWEIIHCENADDCPARKNPQKECWEMARESCNDKYALNICVDCIVYLIKTGNPLLSNQEIIEIIEARGRNHLGDNDLSVSVHPLNVLNRFFG
jgi:hypothetical protein